MEKTTQGRLVSIVDDDRGIRQALEALMRSAGLSAEAFASAEDFLASGRLEQTACLVLDVQLPRMTGLELQKHLVDAGASVPIVFITAFEEDHVRTAAIDNGAVAFLNKPLCRGILLSCVQAIIG